MTTPLLPYHSYYDIGTNKALWTGPLVPQDSNVKDSHPTTATGTASLTNGHVAMTKFEQDSPPTYDYITYYVDDEEKVWVEENLEAEYAEGYYGQVHSTPDCPKLKKYPEEEIRSHVIPDSGPNSHWGYHLRQVACDECAADAF